MNSLLLKVRLQSIRYEAVDIVSLRLRSLEGELPVWTPGSHVDVHLPNGMVRSYSLSNLKVGDEEYRLTVQRDPATRGGSKAMHDDLSVGQMLEISQPRNNFPLCESAVGTVFIAGGIGVTPFLPMAQRLNDVRRPWTMYYSVRTPDRAAHLDELQSVAASPQGRLEMNFDGQPGGEMLDLKDLLNSLPLDTHVYCCGPEGMLSTYRVAAVEALPAEQVHFEYFCSTVDAAAGGYIVSLAKSGKEVRVNEGETLLKALQAVGVDVTYSCEQGVCGACKTRVLSGTPDHRDMILSEREYAEGKTMMICCSGSKSERLVLDL
jgi:ferredoxin-NADP reductase